MALFAAGCGGRAVTAPAAAHAAAPVVKFLPAPVAAPVPAPPPAKPTLILIHASATINPDPGERPTPVILRLFELKSASSFDSADFFALIQKESQALGSDLIARDEFQLKPGDQLEVTRKFSDAVTRVAVLVAFRDLDRSIWRTTIAIGDPKPERLQVNVDTRRVRLSTP